MRTGGTVNSAAQMASESAISRHSPWHSPVPYLFGGLAAMFGLIAFALLILACSYIRKLSRYLENGDVAERDPENGNDKGSDGIKVPTVFEEKIVVIMAGDKKPTFLATPISIRACDDNSKKNSSEKFEKNERPKEEMGHQEQQQGQLQEVEQNREISQSQNQETQNQ